MFYSIVLDRDERHHVRCTFAIRNDGNQFLCKRQRSSLHIYRLVTAQFAITSTKKNVRVALWTVPDLRSVLSDVTP